MPTTTCILCNSSKLAPIIDLGFHPLADTFLKPEQLSKAEPTYPLTVSLCLDCGHAMEGFIVPPEARYQENDYSYDSGNSKVSVQHFQEFAKEVGEKYSLTEKDLIVDIGSNVGTLLEGFHSQFKTPILGVEPAPNMAKVANERGVETFPTFFDSSAAAEIKKRGGAKVITATNVYNHIGDMQTFMDDIKTALRPDGVFIFEAPYLKLLIDKMAFDTIYLEHTSYFAVKPLATFYAKRGLAITDVVTNDYMGGSMRMTVALGEANTPIVSEMVTTEETMQLFSTEMYKGFQEKVNAFKIGLLGQLIDAKKAGGKIIGIGAATKGNTLLNFCGIDSTLLEFVTDSSPYKIGKLTPGSHIPIKPDEAITSEITHALILPWNIAEFLKGKLQHLNLQFITPHMD